MSKFCLVGGDERNIELAKSLILDGHNVTSFANENIYVENMEKCNSIDDVFKYKNIITAIPITKDKIYLTSIYSDLKIEIETFLKKMENKFLISGALSQKYRDMLSKIKIIFWIY